MNLEEIIKRMEAIPEEVKNAKDLESLKKLDDEFEELKATRSILEKHSNPHVVSTDTPQVISTEKTNPLQATVKRSDKTEANYEVRDTLEYRKAFMKYTQEHASQETPMELRAAGDSGTTFTTDIGAAIPNTVLNKFIDGIKKTSYGKIYARVTKMNIKGGVEIPISELEAEASWTTEEAEAEEKKVGDINKKISFKYHMLALTLSTSLLVNIVSLDAFETKLAQELIKGFVKAMDKAIINGTGSGQPLGITKDERVTNVVKFKSTEIGNWKSWITNLFSLLPIEDDENGVLILAKSTLDRYLRTMSDKNDNPLFSIATNGSINERTGVGYFFGREVILVEPAVLKDYDTAANDEVFGIYCDLSKYIINFNQQIYVKRYYDRKKRQYIDEGIAVIDGKPGDTRGMFLLKKDTTGAAAASASTTKA